MEEELDKILNAEEETKDIRVRQESFIGRMESTGKFSQFDDEEDKFLMNSRASWNLISGLSKTYQRVLLVLFRGAP